jgi:hypothetical protein
VAYCNIPAGQGVKAISILISQQNASVPFFYQPPEVTDVFLLSGNKTGRTDGLICEAGQEDCPDSIKERLVIVGKNLGVDGLKPKFNGNAITNAFDLLVSDDDGNMKYYQNTGSATSPYVEKLGEENPLHGVTLQTLINNNRIGFKSTSIVTVDNRNYNYRVGKYSLIPDMILLRFGGALDYGSMPGIASLGYQRLGHKSVISHNHTHIVIELPAAPGGIYPTKDLKISVLHNSRMRARNTNGNIVVVTGQKWVGNSTASFSYSNPELLSIKNKYVEQRPKWRNTPGCRRQ